MRPEDVEVMIRRLRRARAIVRGEEPDDGDPALRAVLAVLTRDPNALDGLSDNHRIAFSLWAFEGTDPATIAELTGATLSATRSRIFYAQKYLRQAAERDPWLSEWLGGTDDEPR